MKIRFDFIFWVIVFTALSICNWAIAHAQTAQNGIILVCNGGQPDSSKPAQPVDCCTPMKAELAAETATPPLAYHNAYNVKLMKQWIGAFCK
jgi:hypothetical protein